MSKEKVKKVAKRSLKEKRRDKKGRQATSGTVGSLK